MYCAHIVYILWCTICFFFVSKLFFRNRVIAMSLVTHHFGVGQHLLLLFSSFALWCCPFSPLFLFVCLSLRTLKFVLFLLFVCDKYCTVTIYSATCSTRGRILVYEFPNKPLINQYSGNHSFWAVFSLVFCNFLVSLSRLFSVFYHFHSGLESGQPISTGS